MSTLWCRSAIPAWGCPSIRETKYLILSLPRSLTEPAWDYGSADPSWNRTAAACGPPTNPRAAHFFVSLYPPKPKPMNEPAGAPTAFVIGLERFVVICLFMAVLGSLYQSIMVRLLLFY